jgi:hypothetical protein
MKKLLLVALTLVSLTGSAQQYIGLVGGINLTNMTSKNYSYPTGIQKGYSGGLTYTYMIRDHVAFGIGALYSQQGYSRTYEDYTYNGQVIKFSDFSYLSVPIKFGLDYGKTVYGFLDIGLSPGLLLNADTRLQTIYYGTMNSDTKLTMQAFAVSAFAEIGAGYKIKKKALFYISLSPQYTLSRLNKDYVAYGLNPHLYGLTFTTGMKFALR